MRFSPAERALVMSHAQVLELMAGRCEELAKQRNPFSLEAARLREFCEFYRCMAVLHARDAEPEEEEEEEEEELMAA